jgi:hypothetical protein
MADREGHLDDPVRFVTVAAEDVNGAPNGAPFCQAGVDTIVQLAGWGNLERLDPH